MNTRRTFRTIWKINAVIILAGGFGICTMLGYAAFSFFHDRLERRHRDDIVNVEATTQAQWQLGAFAPISGTRYMVAPVYSAQAYSIGISEKEASAVRNYLFVDTQDKTSRWLIFDNARLILSMEQVDDDCSVIGWNTKDKTVKWLFLEIVPADTNGDKRLTAADRRAIAIADADGSRYEEVLQGIDRVLGKTCRDREKLLVVYSAADKNLLSEIDVINRKITATKELPRLAQ